MGKSLDFVSARWVKPLLLLVALLSLSVVVFGQENGGMPKQLIPEKTPDVLAPGIRSDAIIMRNSAGENIFVPKTSYEAFELFLRNEGESASTLLSRESLEQMTISISTEPDIAHLKVDVEAQLSEPSQRWLNIPIGLGLVQAIPSILDEGGNLEFPSIRVSSDSSGYLWKVPPDARLRKRLAFEAVGKLITNSQGQSIRLDIPLVPTTLKLKLPLGAWDLNLDGSGSEVIEPFREIDGMSVAIARTSGGATTLSWAKKRVVDQVQAIEVESQTKYSPMLETGQFRAITNFTVRGPKPLGGRRFLITLPKSAVWREPAASPIAFPGVRIGKLDSIPQTDETTLYLDFEEAVSRMDMAVAIEWQSTLGPEEETASFGIPKIEGVQRHFGTLDLTIPRNVQFQWEPKQGIQLIKQSQSSDGSDALVYSFRMNQQTDPLIARWIQGDRLSKLKGSYNVVYEQPMLRLTGSIDILGDIRSLPFLQLDVQGWTVDRVQLQPSGRELDLVSVRSSSTPQENGKSISRSSIALSLGELLDGPTTTVPNTENRSDSIPDPGNEPSVNPPAVSLEPNRRVNVPRSILFVLSKPIPTMGNNSPESISFSLPILSWIDPESQKRLSICVGGELVVQSNSSKLQRTGGGSSWIRSFNDVDLATPTATVSLTKSQPTKWRSEFKYKVTNSDTWSEWIGTAENLGATIQARCENIIKVDETSIDTVQSWRLRFIGRTPASLRIAVPVEWLGESKSDLSSIIADIDRNPVGMELIHDPVPDNSIDLKILEAQQHIAWIRLKFKESLGPQIETSERTLTIQNRVNDRGRAPGSRSSFDWILPKLATDASTDTISIERFSGEVQLAPNIQCLLSLPKSFSSSSEQNPWVAMNPIPFDCTQSEPRLSGEWIVAQSDYNEAVVVESTWLQSVLNAVEQRERYVVRFKTGARRISVDLPANRLTDIKVLVNGRKASMTLDERTAGRIDIALDPMSQSPKVNSEKSYVLEIFSWPTTQNGWITCLRAEPLKIQNCKNREALIWQIIVPTTSHLIGTSSSLSPGYSWNWQDLWFGRKSDWTQDLIETQMGATSQPLISQQTNQYVLFALNQNASMRVWMAPRYLLWIPVALFTLVASFVVIEFQWIRKPWLGISMLLASLAFSQWAWDLSIAVAQCFVAAMGVALLYSILKWMFDRRSRRRSVFASRPTTSLVPQVSRPLSTPGVSVPASVLPVSQISSDRNANSPELLTTTLTDNVGEIP